ncbi:MAG: NUDIX domain-containing protein [Planctomycetota bacterium]
MIHERDCVRALLVTGDSRILLLHYSMPERGDDFEMWLTPGGGIRDGETRADALRREVFEETGLVEFEIGPHVWNREHAFEERGRRVCQREAYFLVPTERFEPFVFENPEAHERDATVGYRWWSIEEIRACDDLFVPTRLGELLADLLMNGPPGSPVATGV